MNASKDKEIQSRAQSDGLPSIFEGLLTTAVILGLAFLLSSCGKPPEAGHGGMPPPMVQVEPPEQRSVTEWDEFTGRTEPVESVEVRPRITGYLQTVNFKSGQFVNKGDLLFQIDPRWQQADADRTAAAVEVAAARLASAESESKRAEVLVKSRAISTEDADTRRNGLAAARAALHQAEAARDFAKLDLDFTAVRAPISGRISRALVTEGNYISGVAGFTTLLTSIVSVDPVYVYAAVDEGSYIKYTRLIQEKKIADPQHSKVPAQVRIAGDTEWKRRGFIESFDNRITAGSGSIVMRVLLENADNSVPVGTFARIRIPAGPAFDALLVDEKLIATDQSIKYVLTVGEGNVAAVSPVKLGGNVDGKRIITEGLKPGDKLITSNTQFVIPGMPVSPQPAAPAAGKIAQN